MYGLRGSDVLSRLFDKLGIEPQFENGNTKRADQYRKENDRAQNEVKCRFSDLQSGVKPSRAEKITEDVKALIDTHRITPEKQKQGLIDIPYVIRFMMC